MGIRCNCDQLVTGPTEENLSSVHRMSKVILPEKGIGLGE